MIHLIKTLNPTIKMEREIEARLSKQTNIMTSTDDAAVQVLHSV